MNVLEARVILRDRSMLDVVDLALRFVVRYAKAYGVVAAVVLLPSLALSAWTAAGLGWGWAWTLALGLAPFASAPFTALASRLLFEPGVRARDAISLAAAALPRLVGTRIVEGISITIATTLFLLPAVGVATFFFYTNEVVVLERARVGAALSRLQRLLSGQSGDALMALLFLTALHIVAVFLADVVGRALLEDVLEFSAPSSILEDKGSMLGLVGFWLFVPFGATCRFLLYINGRTRTEGWDVQTRFAAIAARAEAEGQAPDGRQARVQGAA